jgi:hypothetical protein
MNDPNKMLYNVPSISNFKFDNYEEFEAGGKKKLKTGRDSGKDKKGGYANQDAVSKMNAKNNIKNTYINKINQLITDVKPPKPDDDKKYFLTFLLMSVVAALSLSQRKARKS